MRKFSFLWMTTIALVVGMATIACSKDEVPAPQDEPEFYTVNLGWEGEILDVSYEPLTRSNSADDLYGIQVYSTPDKEGEAFTTWTPYAYGLFDGATDISINLLKGYKYKFVATMVVNGKNVIRKELNAYSYPFFNGGSISIGETFDYRVDKEMNALRSGTSTLRENRVYNHPNTERFYGELTDYTPGENGAKAKIHMKRTSFGAKFIAKGTLASEGTLKIMMDGAPDMMLELSNSNNQISDIFTFYNVKAAWENNQYSETITTYISWIRPDGTVVPLNSHELTFKRNATTVVNVTIDDDGSSNGFDFDIPEGESGAMTDDPDEVNIENGVIVDTDVSTNQ